MKKGLIIIILIAIVNMVKAAEIEEITATSQIREVTVYPANAHITREIKLDMLSGINIFRIQGLSPYINEQSLQVLGTGNIVIHSSHFEVNYISSLESEQKIKDLIFKIKDLDKQIQLKNSRIQVLNEQKDLLDKNKRLNENGLSVEELIKLVNYFDEKLTAIHAENSRLQFEISELNEQKQQLNNQLVEFNQGEKTPSGEIVLKIESRSKASSTIEISYLTTQAGWSPAYDIKVKDVDSDINLVFKAHLFNNTREDWDNVNLTLSNGNPNYSGVLPELHPWYLDLYREVFTGYGNQSKRSMPAAVEMAMQPAMEEDAIEEPSVKPLETRYIEQATTVEYAIEKPYSLKSNNESVQVDLRTFEIPATYKYYVVPKLDRSAYLIASIADWDQQGLLDGPANLYFQNRYVGKTFVNSQQLADEFKISLGQDKSIVVKREMIDNFEKKNLIGTDIIESRGFRITVRNTKSKSISIIVYDQIPVSANNEITVKVLESGNAELDEKTGRLTWEWTLDQGSSKETEFGYEVKYPKDELVLLN